MEANEEISEQPFAAVVNCHLIKNVCSNCFRMPKNLLRCAKCKYVHYCDAFCQKSDWAIHKFECKCVKRLEPADELVRHMARIIWAIRSKTVSEKEKYRTFDQLMAHETEIKNDPLRQEYIKETFTALKLYFGNDSAFPTFEHLLLIFGKLMTNSFDIMTTQPQSIGKGLYLRLSLIDHSCDPNACVVFEGCTAILRPLKSGIILTDLSKVFICYTEPMQTKLDRKQHLDVNYYFDCLCSRCSNENDETDLSMISCTCETEPCNCEVVQQMRKTEIKINEVNELKKNGIVNLDKFQLVQMVTNTLNEFSSLGSMNLSKILLYEWMFNQCREMGDRKGALKYGNMMLPAYRLYYPAASSTLLQLLFKLAKIQISLQNLEEARLLLAEAKIMCATSFGPKHSFYNEIIEMSKFRDPKLKKKKKAQKTIEGQSR